MYNPDFEWGHIWGRLYISAIVDRNFCGLALLIGRDYNDDINAYVYHITTWIGSSSISIGIRGKELELS